MKRLPVLPLVLGLLVFSGHSASAQISRRKTASAPSAKPASVSEPVVSNTTRTDYRVDFEADELAATLEDGTIPRIVCRGVKGFALLTRPRTHFVNELLKSVEVM